MSEDLPDRLNRRLPPFPRQLGMRFTAATTDRLLAEVPVREDSSNGQGAMHGGALMAFADTMGAVATVLNMAPGMRTTTLESKTNFIAAAPIGDMLSGETTPLHRGKTTQVWCTRISRTDGRLVAVVTQTQIILPT